MTTKERAETIIKQHAKNNETVVKWNEKEYVVKGSKDSQYRVYYNNGWFCDCPSYKYNCGIDEGRCKHIMAVEQIRKDNITVPNIDDIMEREA